MKLLITTFEILSWVTCGFVLWVIYPILLKLITAGVSLHRLWS